VLNVLLLEIVLLVLCAELPLPPPPPKRRLKNEVNEEIRLVDDDIRRFGDVSAGLVESIGISLP
jgi:hypothetical protein